MAEWVLRGSLKGPQGEAGADAQLPEGGTDGQVLTKTADGEAWQDAPETDLTGYLSIDENNILQTTDGGTKSPTYIKVKTNPIIEAYTHIASGSVTASTKAGQASIEATCGDTYARLVSQYDWPASIETNGELKMGSKSVSSITDTISTSPSGNALVTDKAVADYVAENAPEVDLSEVVKIDGSNLVDYQGTPITDLTLGDNTSYTQISYGAMRVKGQSGTLFMVDADGGSISVGSKSVTSITDSISASPSGNALATDKAVADYVAANASTVKTASNQDFCKYFGMEYNAEDWS